MQGKKGGVLQSRAAGCITRDWIANRDPPILAFFNFLSFFVFRFPLFLFVCGAFFLSYPRILRGSAKRQPLAFFGVSLAFSKKARPLRAIPRDLVVFNMLRYIG